jgi:hypothetical protein
MIKIKGYKILNNIYLLYVVFFITLINLFSLMYNKNYKSVILFSVIVLVVYLFNKNMIIILLTALIITNIMNLTNKEGYNNKKKEDENVDELSEDIVDEKLVNDDLVKQISNMAIDKLLTNYEDMSNNIVVNTPTLNETTTEMDDLNKKIDKVTTETSMKEKNDLMYNKINELNTKMNELTALIQ